MATDHERAIERLRSQHEVEIESALAAAAAQKAAFESAQVDHEQAIADVHEDISAVRETARAEQHAQL